MPIDKRVVIWYNNKGERERGSRVTTLIKGRRFSSAFQILLKVKLVKRKKYFRNLLTNHKRCGIIITEGEGKPLTPH